MTIRNETEWRTDHLRAFLATIAENELDPRIRRKLQIIVTNGARTSGTCDGGFGIRLSLPDQIDRLRLCQVAAWLMAAWRGTPRNMLTGAARYDPRQSPGAFYDWAKTLPLHKRPVKTPPNRSERLEAEYRRAVDTLLVWQRKRKLAETKLKRWQKRVKVLQVRAVAAKLGA